AGIYFNTAAKVIVSNVVSGVKEEFVGDEYYQTAGLTVVLTPLVLLGESLVFYFLPGKDFDLLYFVFRMFAATACNLVAVPFIFPVVKVISRED
ncbi:hypothetical protein HZB08_01070, partial [Candidatus Saganbacteria bacterium]|nr:hypothetical protein [Candidatus Saganbacteria bacterium]